MRLLDFLFPPRVDEKILQETSLDAFFALLAPRLVSETRPGTVALFPFSAASVRAALHEAKYHGSERAFSHLAAALAEYLRDGDERLHKAIVVPVPLGALRQKERGYNQVEETAKRAAAELGLSVESGILLRTRETVSQVSLPRRAREENMRGAFGAAHRADPARTYILLDDVITTGATLQAAIETLQNAGAEHIIPLALAH